MVLVRVSRHPRGLSPAMQQRVYALRTVHKMSFQAIAPKVKNLAGDEPNWQVCRDTYHRLCACGPAACSKYQNCGRSATITPEIRRWLVSRLKVLRKTTVCTSTMLQRELAKKKGVIVEASTVRRHLVAAGYKWLPRSTARTYTDEERRQRKDFAEKVLEMTPQQLKSKVHLSMDGVVLTIPPEGLIARRNFVRTDDKRVWRTPQEHDLPALSGHDPYAKQVPMRRALPLWGGISAAGFATILFHPKRKITADDWASAVNRGLLVKALRDTNPQRRRGPWKILCDNESFLGTDASADALKKAGVTLWSIPPRSPDLNPVEKYWAWVRRRMRAMDLADLSAKRAVVDRAEYKRRFSRLVKTAKGKEVAGNIFVGLMKTCRKVVAKGGRASGD